MVALSSLRRLSSSSRRRFHETVCRSCRLTPSLAIARISQVRFSGSAADVLAPLLRNDVHSRRLLEIARADPDLAEALSQQDAAHVEDSETSAANVADVVPLTSSELKLIAVNAFIPFVGFGFFDNFIMIIAGEALDTTLCVTFGYTTMVAAALGNTLSDIFGIGLGGLVETAAEKLGLPKPEASAQQQQTLAYKMYYQGGSVVGIVLGCFLGMVPLLFIDSKGEELRARKAMEDELGGMVEEKLSTVVHADRTTLFVYDAERRILVSKVAKGEAKPIEVPISDTKASYVTSCFLSGKVVNESNIPDSEMQKKIGYRMNNVLCVPVMGSDSILGVVQMLNKVGADSFSPADGRIAQRFSAIIAYILQGQQGMDNVPAVWQMEQKRQVKDQNLQLQDDIFNTVMVDLGTLLDADRASLFLVDEEGENLFTVVSQDTDPIRVSFDHSLVGYVAKTKRSLNLEDAYESELFCSDTDKRTGYRTKSVLASPVLSASGDVMGVLELMNKKDGEVFSSRDAKLLEAFTMHVAVVLESFTDSTSTIVKRLKTEHCLANAPSGK